MANGKKNAKVRPEILNKRVFRNLLCAMLLLALGAGISYLSMGLLSALVDIESHEQAWMAAYVISVFLTLMIIVVDAAMTTLVCGVFACMKGLVSRLMRLFFAVFRVFAMFSHGAALVMGVVMVMRFADAFIATVMIVLHLGLMLTGCFGVRCLEKKLWEEWT